MVWNVHKNEIIFQPISKHWDFVCITSVYCFLVSSSLHIPIPLLFEYDQINNIACSSPLTRRFFHLFFPVCCCLVIFVLFSYGIILILRYQTRKYHIKQNSGYSRHWPRYNYIFESYIIPWNQPYTYLPITDTLISNYLYERIQRHSTHCHVKRRVLVGTLWKMLIEFVRMVSLYGETFIMKRYVLVVLCVL